MREKTHPWASELSCGINKHSEKQLDILTKAIDAISVSPRRKMHKQKRKIKEYTPLPITICKNCKKARSRKTSSSWTEWECTQWIPYVLDFTDGTTRQVNKSVFNQGSCHDYKERSRKPK